MNSAVELSRNTWGAAVKLALILSVVAAVIAVVVSAAGDVPQAAVVLPVIVVAFTMSWIQTGRSRQDAAVRFVDWRHDRVERSRHHSVV